LFRPSLFNSSNLYHKTNQGEFNKIGGKLYNNLSISMTNFNKV